MGDLGKKEYHLFRLKTRKRGPSKCQGFFKKGKKIVAHESAPKKKPKIRRINDRLPDAAKVKNLISNKYEEEGNLKDLVSNHDET